MTTSMKKTAAVLAFLVITGGCQLVAPEDDPVRVKQVDIDNRLSRVERVMDNQGLMDLMSEIDALRRENELLRNDVDVLRNTVEQAGERQKQLYLDVDQRLQLIEGSNSAATAADGSIPQAASASSAAVSVDDRGEYQAAFELLKARQYGEATTAFRRFLADHPESGLADNAQYWLAESIYVVQQYEAALAEFGLLLERYPGSPKTPDALLKLGYCHYELKRYGEARDALSLVIRDHADSSAARLARERLQVMAAAGH